MRWKMKLTGKDSLRMLRLTGRSNFQRMWRLIVKKSFRRLL